MNKLIKGVSEDGLNKILDILVISFNGYYNKYNNRDMLIDKNDFEISKVLYSNSDMCSIYNLHLKINMLNKDTNKTQIREIIIITNSNLLEATCKMHFNHPKIEQDYFYFVFDIDGDDDNWFTYY